MMPQKWVFVYLNWIDKDSTIPCLNGWQPQICGRTLLKIPKPPIANVIFHKNSNPNQDNQCGTEISQNIISHSKLKDFDNNPFVSDLIEGYKIVIRNENVVQTSRDF